MIIHSGSSTPTSLVEAFRADVLRGLRTRPKELPCKYFYDEAGSKLFEQICHLPEYYLTRTELAIMRQHVPEMARLLGHRCLLIEYGSGSSLKTRLLLDRMEGPDGYLPVDMAVDQLRQSAAALAREYPHLRIEPLCADFTGTLDLPALDPSVRRRVVYFPGSTIGNFPPAETVDLLRRTAQLCGPGGGLLLGADLKKDPRLLHAAYNDRDGITAAFNLNLLGRINRELAGDFDEDQFWHHAFYDPAEGRIEMHLVSRRDQHVHVGEREFFLAEGESIRTEYSYKYSTRDLRGLASAAGFAMQRVWTDGDKYFSVLYFTVETTADGTAGADQSC